MSGPGILEINIHRIQKMTNTNLPLVMEDVVAVEEPLEIRLGFQRGREDSERVRQSISITMRTPGDDHALATGFLFTEGLIHRSEQITEIVSCGSRPTGPGWEGREELKLKNVVRVELDSHTDVDLQRLQRNFYTTSSCGVCGKTSLEALRMNSCSPLATPTPSDPMVEATTIHRLPDILGQYQSLFAKTGGLHAAALFDYQGNLLQLCEDVGRHNAMDKLIGHQFLQGQLPLKNKIILVSGRASFELMQKALMAQVPILAAVGAPSSLSVQVAQNFHMTLLGFVRNNRFNIYHGSERILTSQ